MQRSLTFNNTWAESICACLCLLTIGFLNVGLVHEERSAVVEQVTWELRCQLALNDTQTKEVMAINYEYYDKLSGLTDGAFSIVVRQKNKKIMKILNEDQQVIWMKNCAGGKE